MLKFLYIFEGTYVINKIIGPNACLISDVKTGAAMGAQNVKNLKPYIATSQNILHCNSL
jgi:hypothetical protein